MAKPVIKRLLGWSAHEKLSIVCIHYRYMVYGMGTIGRAPSAGGG